MKPNLVRAITLTMSMTLSFAVAPALGSDRQYPDHSFQPDRGMVPDEKTAIKIAEAVLFPVYGEEQIKGEEPFRVALDGDVWVVEGKNLPPNSVGGVVLLRISKIDARIIQMTHGK